MARTNSIPDDDGVNESQGWPGPPEDQDNPLFDDTPDLLDLADDVAALQQPVDRPETKWIQ